MARTQIVSTLATLGVGSAAWFTLIADPPVNLQASTPGTQQTGHVNVSGTIIGGAFSGTSSSSSGR